MERHAPDLKKNYSFSDREPGLLVGDHPITQSATGSLVAYGVLDLRNQITGGNIFAVGGSVMLNGVTLTNLDLGSGQFDTAASANLAGNISLNSNTVFNVNNGHTLNLYLAGATPCTITNNGVINLKSSGTDTLLSAHAAVTLTGAGSVTLGADSTNQLTGEANSSFINDVHHTIQGGGSIMCPAVNNGKIIANHGAMSLTGMVTGSGSVSVADNASLSVQPGLQCGNFSMSPLANLNLPGNGSIMDLKGNYSFAQTDPAKVNFADWTLMMSGGNGGGKQSLEVGGRDYGISASGYNNNFNLTKLQVTGAGTYASLVDVIDNGRRAGGCEVLYVETLQVDPGATLNLNGLRLYARRDGTIYLVSAGQGELYGHGEIINTAAASGRAINSLLLQ
jgi:hypothetical protein